MVDRETTYIILTYILTALFITWPLVLHLDGFLLPKTVKDIHNHTIDTKRFIQLMTKSVRLFSEGKDFIIVLKDYAFPPLYALSAIPAILVFGLDRVVFHNIYLLTNIILAGVTMYLLMLELSGDKTASFFSGFLYMSSNCQLHHYVFGHTHYILIHWIPLIFLLIEKCLHKKNVRYAVMLGLILALQVLSSLQYSVYLSFIIPAYIALKISLVDRRILGDKHFWRSMVVAVFIALTLSSFYTVKRLSMEGPVRTIQDNLNPYWTLNSLKLLFDVNLNVHLGVIQFALMLWGVCIIFSETGKEKWRRYWPFVFLFIFLVVCMMGPFSRLAPYYWLYRFWPFIKNFRVARRLFPFALMCSSILSSLFLVHMKNREGLRRYRVMVLAAVMIMVIVFQVLPSHYLTDHHMFYYKFYSGI